MRARGQAALPHFVGSYQPFTPDAGETSSPQPACADGLPANKPPLSSASASVALPEPAHTSKQVAPFHRQRDTLREPSLPSRQGFSGSEHAALGNAATGNEPIFEMVLDDGSTLSFGDMVALAGDLFGSVNEMRHLAGTPEGRLEIRWARWWTIPNFGPEPPAPPSVKQRVRARYYRLAAANNSHFNAGGTALASYREMHREALRKAYVAGATQDRALFAQAVTDEAFGHHYLTDMFSSGHVRTPIEEIRRAYEREIPSSTDQLVEHIATLMVAHLKKRKDIPWFWPDARVKKTVAEQIRGLGGAALDRFSLGDMVALAYHNADGEGLNVISDLDPEGRRVPGGFRWRAVGDGNMEQGTINWDITIAAMRVSRAEIQRAWELGQRAARPGNPTPAPEHVAAALAAFEPYGAEPYIPREAPQGSNPTLAWHWGHMNREMMDAIDDALRSVVVHELRQYAPVPPVQRYDRSGKPNPKGPVQLHVGEAFEAFCKELVSGGIRVLEQAIGRPAGASR